MPMKSHGNELQETKKENLNLPIDSSPVVVALVCISLLRRNPQYAYFFKHWQLRHKRYILLPANEFEVAMFRDRIKIAHEHAPGVVQIAPHLYTPVQEERTAWRSSVLSYSTDVSDYTEREILLLSF